MLLHLEFLSQAIQAVHRFVPTSFAQGCWEGVSVDLCGPTTVAGVDVFGNASRGNNIIHSTVSFLEPGLYDSAYVQTVINDKVLDLVDFCVVSSWVSV